MVGVADAAHRCRPKKKRVAYGPLPDLTPDRDGNLALSRRHIYALVRYHFKVDPTRLTPAEVDNLFEEWKWLVAYNQAPQLRDIANNPPQPAFPQL